MGDHAIEDNLQKTRDHVEQPHSSLITSTTTPAATPTSLVIPTTHVIASTPFVIPTSTPAAAPTSFVNPTTRAATPSSSSIIHTTTTDATSSISSIAHTTTFAATPSTSSITPTTSTHASIPSTTPSPSPTMIISDEMGNRAKFNGVLHPDSSLWFSKRKVVKKVTLTSYKQYFDKPYNNFSMVPEEVRRRWWHAFRTKEKHDEKPKPSDVFKRAHTRKDGSFNDERSASLWDTLQQKQVANNTSDEPKTEEELYYEVFGGFDEKGRMYGIGSAAESYYEKPSSSKKGQRAPSQHVINLENRVVQLTSENLQQQQLLNETVSHMKLLQRQVELLTQQVTGCSSTIGTPQPPPPPPPPRSGSTFVS